MKKFFWTYCVPLLLLFQEIHFSNGENESESSSTHFGSCALHCREQNVPRKLMYEVGKKYLYNFTTQVHIWNVNGASDAVDFDGNDDIETDDKEWFKVEGEAAVIALNSCEHILTVNYINIIKKTRQQIKVSQEHPNLRFAFEDGQIGKICLHRNDTVSSGNIKKAIISMLQTSLSNQENFSEVDISGLCPIIYEAMENGSMMKTKDLYKCKNPDELSDLSHGIPSSSDDGYKPVDFKNSTSKCVQTIKTNIVDQAECKEIHNLYIDSANILIRSSIQLVSTEDNSVTDQNDTKEFILSSLVFSEKQNSLKYDNVLSSKMENITDELCLAFKSNTVTSELAKSAFEFLEIIGKMETVADLEAIKKKIFNRNCAEEIAYKINYLYHIALAKSPNQATIEYFANYLLQNPEIIERFLPDFISNIGWSQNMEIRDNLISLLKLMDVEFPGAGNLKRNFILAAAQAIHKYSRNVANFRNDNLILSLLQKTEENVNVLDFLEQINALGNLPQISKGKSEEFDCLNWPTRNTTRTESLYCVYAFQSDACNPVWKIKIRNILKQSQAESDIKIQAYLSAWRCLDLNDVATIESLFEDFDSNSDVLGFITSHLQNMVKNGNSLMENNKILVDKLSTMIEPIKEKQTRQLSKNYAWVFFDKEIDVRVHLDVNVLFSSRSYVPSFVNGNLTVEFRGISLNILEMGIASDQIQALIDEYIGPKTSAVVDREEILLFVRIFGATIYSDKISAQNLYNSIFSSATNLLRSKSYAKMLPFLFDDKIIDVFQHWKHYNEYYLVPTVAGYLIKVHNQGNTLAALKLQSKGLLQWSPFRNTSFTSKFAPSFVTTFSNIVTVEMEEYHGIGFSNEAFISSASDLTLSSSAVADEPSVKMQLDFPIEGLEIFKLDRKSFWIEKDKFSTKRRSLRPNTINDWPGEFHGCTDFLPTVLSLKICNTDDYTDMRYGERNTFWIGAVEDDENQTKKIIALDFTWNLKENEKSFDFRLHSPSTVNTVSLNSLKANVNYTSSFSSREVTLNVSTPWITSEITVFGDYNVTWQGILTSFSYNGRKYSGEAYQKVSSSLNLHGDYPQIRLSFLDVFFCSLFTDSKRCDVKYETIVQFSHPYSEKNIMVFDSMVEKVTNESLINFHVKTGNVFKIAEGSLEGKIQQSNDVDHLNSSNSEDAQVFLLDIEIVSVALGKLQLNNSYKSYENKNEAIVRGDVNGKYGRFNDENLHTFHFEVVGNASMSMPPGNIDSVISKLRTSQSPFLDSDLIWKVHYFQNSSSVNKVTFLPLRLPSYEFQFTIFDSKWKWLTYKSFDVSEVFSVSMPKQELELFLRFVSMKNAELHTIDLGLDVQNKKDKYSNSLFYDSGTQILKAAISSPKVSYDFKRIISVETSESGSKKKLEKYVVSKNPGNIDLISCMYTKERGKSDVALKYKDEKYFQFSYEDKAEEFQKNNAIFIKDYIDGKILLKTNSDGSIWPIMIQIDSKWIPSKYIITGTILATPEGPYGSNIKLDTDIDWNLIGEENSPSVGKISGMTHVGVRTYELTSLLKINQKGEQDCFLRTNAKLIDESGNSVWKPHVDIVMRNSRDETLFDMSYLFELINRKEIPLFHMQLKGMRSNTSFFNFNTECSSNETATYAFFKAALDIEHKNNFIYKLPVDFDFHLNADWSHEENHTELIGRNKFQHLKVKAASDSGVLPQKWYTWQYTYDVHPSYNPSDFDNKTKSVLAIIVNGESILEQSNGFKRTASCNIIEAIVPTKYANYTCNDHCSRKHSDNTVFYEVEYKRTFQFLYFIREEHHEEEHREEHHEEEHREEHHEEEHREEHHEHTYLNGSSKLSWLMDKWTNIQFLQDHTIWMYDPDLFISPFEESWITMFEFSTNETETKLNFGQPGLLEIKGILNESVAKLSSSVDVPDYETSLKFYLDRNISLDNFQFEISAQSPFEKLNNLSFRIDHMLHTETRTYPTYKMIVLGRANKDLYKTELHWMTKIPGYPFITLLYLEASIQNVDSEWASHYLDFQLAEMGLHGTVAPSRVFVLQSQYRVATDSYFTASGICSPLEFSCDLRFYVPDKADWALAVKQNKEDTPMYQVTIYKELDTFLQLNVDVDYYGQDAETGIWKLLSNATLEGQGLHVIADEIKGRLNAKSRLIAPNEISEDFKREIEFDSSIVFIKEPDSAFPNNSLFRNTYHLFTKFSNFDKATSFKLCTLSKDTAQTKNCIITI